MKRITKCALPVLRSKRLWIYQPVTSMTENCLTKRLTSLTKPPRRRICCHHRGAARQLAKKEVEATIATMARIPAKHVSRDDKAVLASLEDDLKRMVFGQDQAITALASAIKLSRAGLRDAEKPVGNYLFSGPTGVGKTEVAKQLAEALGDQADAV